MSIYQYTNTVYVSPKRSNTISVLWGENNTKVKNIKVNAYPVVIAINIDTNIIQLDSNKEELDKI